MKKIHLILALLFILKPIAFAATGDATLSLQVGGYRVHKEEDGLLGKGVDLYIGSIALGQDKSIGTTTRVAQGLKNDNGKKGDKKFHPRADKILTLSIPENTIVVVNLKMYESDRTTDYVRKRYAKAKLPALKEKAFRGDVSVSIGNKPWEVLADALASLGTIIKNLAEGRTINVDDQYGGLTLVAENIDGDVKFSIHETESRSKGSAIVTQALSKGSSWSDISHLKYRNRQNSIVAVIQAKVS